MLRQEDCKVKPCAGKFKNANSGTAEIRQEEGSTSQEGGGTPRTRHTGPRWVQESGGLEDWLLVGSVKEFWGLGEGIIRKPY